MAQKLEEQEENALEIKENFSSLQQEVDIKTKKLKKVKTIKFIVCISCSEMCLKFYLSGESKMIHQKKSFTRKSITGNNNFVELLRLLLTDNALQLPEFFCPSFVGRWNRKSIFLILKISQYFGSRRLVQLIPSYVI